MLPLHKTGLRSQASSQKLPCRHHGSSVYRRSQREGWKKATLFGGKGFPRDAPISFARSSKTHV